MPEGLIESGADLVASLPSDFMLDITPDTTVDASAPDSAEAETFETPGDLDEPVLPEADDADLPEEEAAEEEPVVPEVKAADDLPEGVKKGKDRSGKDGLFVEPKRWETIHGNHKLVQEVSNIIGEPATLPALQLREQAYQAQEMLFNDLTSGDPASQQKVANYFLDQMQQARDSGEVGVDPTVPFAQTIYSALKEKSPDAFANLRLMGARDLATEIFDAAAKSGDADLFTSMQHVVRALTGAAKGTDSAGVRALAEKMGIPFHARSEMENLARGADPVALLRQQNAALQAQLNGRTSNNQAAQFGDWQKQTNTAIEQGIASDAVQPALASVAEAWKSFPAEYKTHVVDALHSKVDEIVRADPNLKAKITSLQSRAKSATSAQARNDIAAQIRTAYVNRAKLATDAALRPVLDSANKILTGLSNSNHARRSAAQGRTAPTRGAQGSVNRSITPDAGMPGGIFDPSVAVRQGLAAFR